MVIEVGEGDVVVGPRIHAFPLAEQVPRNELIAIPDGGRQLPYSHPDVMLDAIERAFELAD